MDDPIIELDGTDAGDTDGLVITRGGADSKITGLEIVEFKGNGIVLEGSSDAADFEGKIDGGTVVESNVISRNDAAGILVMNSRNIVIGGPKTWIWPPAN